MNAIPTVSWKTTDKTKSFRHDIRNHIAVVKKLLQSEKLEEAVTYMEELDDMAEKMSFPCSTNNPVVDILVGNKLGIVKQILERFVFC